MTSNFILAPDEEFIQCPYNTSHHVTNARFIRHLTKCREAYLKALTTDERTRAMRICRHNALHHIPYPEMKFHEDNCRSANSVVTFLSYHNSVEGKKQYEDRRRFDEESRKRHRSPSPPPSYSKHRKDSKDRHHRDRDRDSRDSSRYRKSPDPAPTSTNANAWGLEEDDWEADSQGHTAGYDPKIKLNSEIIIHNPSGLTKSERKVFREEVRQRAADKASEGRAPDNSDESAGANSDVRPDMRNPTNVNVKREPGEIDDEEESNFRETPSVSAGARERLNQNSQRSTAAPSASSSRSTSHSNYNQASSSTSSSNIGSWYDTAKMDYSDDEPDPDDYAGYDPYAHLSL